MNPFVAHFAADLPSGAGNGALRQHLALRRAGVDSRIYFNFGEALDPTIVPAYQNQSFYWRNAVAITKWWKRRREAVGGNIISPYWARRTPIQAFGELPSVINLHWIAQWLDLPSFFGSLPAGMPVVWTIRDLIPITGGCGYPDECEGFTRQCGNCPQLKTPRPNDASHRFFKAKAHLYEKSNLHFVGNSEWTTAQVRRSALAKHAKSIRTIHNGLDVEQYKPVEKSIARKALRIPEGRFVVGFACLDVNEKRKGAKQLMEALKAFPSKEIILLVLGTGKWPASEFETITIGSLFSPRLQSVFYSALDVFAMPSMDETFGNTAIEAMACQTPVVAYSTGGLADIITNGETGLMERDIGSIAGLTQMLSWMQTHPMERAAMGIAARQRVVEKFSDALMARRYMSFYQELTLNEFAS